MKHVVLALWCAAVAGCGAGPGVPQGHVRVSGQVMMDGSPLAMASVMLINGTDVGVGATDSSGRFELARGAKPGPNRVVISKTDGPETDPARVVAGPDGVPPAARELLPTAYSDPLKTTLTFDVPEEGASDARFELSSQ